MLTVDMKANECSVGIYSRLSALRSLRELLRCSVDIQSCLPSLRSLQGWAPSTTEQLGCSTGIDIESWAAFPTSRSALCQRHFPFFQLFLRLLLYTLTTFFFDLRVFLPCSDPFLTQYSALYVQRYKRRVMWPHLPWVKHMVTEHAHWQHRSSLPLALNS